MLLQGTRPLRAVGAAQPLSSLTVEVPVRERVDPPHASAASIDDVADEDLAELLGQFAANNAALARLNAQAKQLQSWALKQRAAEDVCVAAELPHKCALGKVADKWQPKLLASHKRFVFVSHVVRALEKLGGSGEIVAALIAAAAALGLTPEAQRASVDARSVIDGPVRSVKRYTSVEAIQEDMALAGCFSSSAIASVVVWFPAYAAALVATCSGADSASPAVGGAGTGVVVATVTVA